MVEPTSALDEETTRKVEKTLLALLPGPEEVCWIVLYCDY
jgi:ABC-type iron transport system FetAB ATPase subunit